MRDFVALVNNQRLTSTLGCLLVTAKDREQAERLARDYYRRRHPYCTVMSVVELAHVSRITEKKPIEEWEETQKGPSKC